MTMIPAWIERACRSMFLQTAEKGESATIAEMFGVCYYSTAIDRTMENANTVVYGGLAARAYDQIWFGESMLHLAIRCGHPEVARQLLNIGIDANSRDASLST